MINDENRLVDGTFCLCCSSKAKRLKAGWNDTYLAKVLSGRVCIFPDARSDDDRFRAT
jgi:hypothetical protein